MMKGAQLVENVNINKPRYDQNTYIGRAKHFFLTANPLNLFVSNEILNDSKKIVDDFRKGEVDPNLSLEQLWRAKHIYDSAFHPETGEKMFIVGRMSFQVPGNMAILGGMLNFYKSSQAVILWQWLNQTFNAIVNYTNRSGSGDISVQKLLTSYVLGTSGAVSTAILINRQVKNLPPLIGRLVPFAAVAAANCINIPCMRSQEFSTGIKITDESGEKEYEYSKKVAKRAVAQVTVSRILIAVPGMVIPPIVMNSLEKKGVLAKYPKIGFPVQLFLSGVLLTFATPLGCALFPQQSSVSTKSLEKDVQNTILAKNNGVLPEKVYYNKGL